MADRLSTQLAFILEIDRLKTVIRRTYLVDGSRHENSAEHSWHLAVMALLLVEHAEAPVNLERLVQLVLIHDLVEIGAGDTYAYAGVDAEATREREEKAARELFIEGLPDDQGRAMLALWHEFDTGKTPEARFARTLDRLMPLLHNFHTVGRSWKAHGVTADQVRARMLPMRDGSEVLWRYAEDLVDQAVLEGMLPEK